MTERETDMLSVLLHTLNACNSCGWARNQLQAVRLPHGGGWWCRTPRGLSSRLSPPQGAGAEVRQLSHSVVLPKAGNSRNADEKGANVSMLWGGTFSHHLTRQHPVSVPKPHLLRIHSLEGRRRTLAARSPPAS